MPNRRQFIQLGFISSLLIGGVSLFYDPKSGQPKLSGAPYKILSEEDLATLTPLVSVFLANSVKNQKDIQTSLSLFDQALSGLALSSQNEIRQLLDVFNFAPTRKLIFGVWSHWGNYSSEELDKKIECWKTSSLSLKRSAYLALAEIFAGSWYAQPSTWKELDYEGPPDL